MTDKKVEEKSQGGGSKVVISLVVLAVLAVGAMAYLSGQITSDDKYADKKSDTVAAAEPASGEADQTEEAVQTADAGEATEVDASDEAAAVAQEAAMQIEPGNPVVAKVGDEEIKRLDVLNFITQLPPNIRQLPIEQLFTMALEQVVNGKIIEMNVDTAAVEKEEAVQAQIETAKQQIIRNAYLEQQVEEKMTEDKLQAAFKEQVADIPDVEEVKAAHILVEDEETAKNIIAQLNDGGDFAELAKENSTDGTAQNGGELGYFAKADVVPEFAEAAFDLKEGAYTKEPVKTQFGFHVIRLDEKRQRPKPTFEQAKPTLEAGVRREILEEIMSSWREDAKVEKFDINGKPLEEKSN